mmetsp:Transcript_31474/g.75383  ORF Transcript_31474/g.75383 Transcript_31474/m.75383 type:complete len:224 (+) Transcript_31474:35-706(+)
MDDKRVTWETAAAEQLAEKCASRGEGGPLLCTVCGPPGSGKSTSAQILKQLLDAKFRVAVLPLDGFHFPLAHLKSWPDAEDAVYYRGAARTFDRAAIEESLRSLSTGEPVCWPDFDHAVGDPTPTTEAVNPSNLDLIIVEGLYTLVFEELHRYWGFSIGIDANVDECVELLKKRNAVIPGYTLEEIHRRCEVVDRSNADAVVKSLGSASLRVNSAAFASAGCL